MEEEEEQQEEILHKIALLNSVDWILGGINSYRGRYMNRTHYPMIVLMQSV